MQKKARQIGDGKVSTGIRRADLIFKLLTKSANE